MIHAHRELGVVDRDRCHLWQYLVGRTESVGSLCYPQRHPYRYHGLHQACVLQGSAGQFLFFLPGVILLIFWASSEACGLSLSGRTG